MFAKLFLFFALVAAAFANPKPDPQVVYNAPGVFPAVGYSPYSAYGAPLAYSAPYAAAVPYAYSAGAYYVK